MNLLPMASLNSVTLLGAETVGRAYGGGMLKLEPGEADQLPVPSVALVLRMREELWKLRSPVTRRLASGDLLGAVELVDRVLLRDGLRVSQQSLLDVRHAHAELTARRVARGKESSRGV